MTSPSTAFEQQDTTIWLTSEDGNCSLFSSEDSSLHLSTLSSPYVALPSHHRGQLAVPLAGAAQCSQESVFSNSPVPHLLIQGSPLPSPIFCSPTALHVSRLTRSLWQHVPAPPVSSPQYMYLHSPLYATPTLLESSSDFPVATYGPPTSPHTYFPSTQLCSPSPLRPASYLHYDQLESPLATSSSLSSPFFCSPIQAELNAESPAADCTVSTTEFDFRYSTPTSVEFTELLTQSCCSRRCLAHLSVIDIERCRKWFGSRNTTQQNQFLLETFQISGCTDPNQPVTLEGKSLCKKAFTSAVDISIKRYDRLYSRFCEGAMQYQRKPTARSEASKVSECKAWMKRFFAQIGDSMPHINQIHLPHVMTKREIYARMKRDLTEEGIAESDVISQSYFYYIWNKCYKNVVIPVVRQLQLLDIHNPLCSKIDLASVTCALNLLRKE